MAYEEGDVDAAYARMLRVLMAKGTIRIARTILRMIELARGAELARTDSNSDAVGVRRDCRPFVNAGIACASTPSVRPFNCSVLHAAAW